MLLLALLLLLLFRTIGLSSSSDPPRSNFFVVVAEGFCGASGCCDCFYDYSFNESSSGLRIGAEGVSTCFAIVGCVIDAGAGLR